MYFPQHHKIKQTKHEKFRHTTEVQKANKNLNARIGVGGEDSVAARERAEQSRAEQEEKRRDKKRAPAARNRCRLCCVWVNVSVSERVYVFVSEAV